MKSNGFQIQAAIQVDSSNNISNRGEASEQPIEQDVFLFWNQANMVII
jgi:hypothetical protein